MKVTYNPTGTLQSTQFTCDMVSPNILFLHGSTHRILETSEAPSGGYPHTHSMTLKMLLRFADSS